MNAHQRELPGLIVHTPITLARRGHIGETVYSERWAEFMAQPPPDWRAGDLDDAREPIEVLMLRETVYDYPHLLGQREASVAASFVTWLGTAIGKCTLLRAAQMRDEFQSNSVLMAWTLQNQRHIGVNHGYRSIDYIVARLGDYNPRAHWLSPIDPFVRQPEVTLRDVELIEHLAGWFGRDAGRGFTFGCEREIARREAHESEMHRRRLSAAITGATA